MISVVIPLYNKESRIAATISSVLSQKGEFEVVVVDDGSTDNSVAIVNNIQDERIRLIRQENGGPSNARNTGMTVSKGDWILLLDADDELLPDAIANFERLVNKYPQEKCFACNFYINDQLKNRLYSVFYSEKIITQPFWAWVFNRLFPRTGAALFHRDVVNEYKFNEQLRRYEDAEWLFRIMNFHHFVRCSKPVMIYNLGSTEASAKRKDIAEDYLGHLDLNSGSYGERIANYQLYQQALNLYPDECKRLYSFHWNIKEKILLKVILQAISINSIILRIARKMLS